MAQRNLHAQLLAAKQQALAQLTTASRAAVADLCAAVLQSTRAVTVTGNLMANMQPSLHAPDTKTTTALDPDGSAAQQKVHEAIQNFQLGDTFYLCNSLPRAAAVEYGQSSKAPSGLFRLAASQWPTFVKRSLHETR